jgi:hypothetical protein
VPSSRQAWESALVGPDELVARAVGAVGLVLLVEERELALVELLEELVP